MEKEKENENEFRRKKRKKERKKKLCSHYNRKITIYLEFSRMDKNEPRFKRKQNIHINMTENKIFRHNGIELITLVDDKM